MLERHSRGSWSYLRGGSGPPLLLLHGIPGSAFTWEAAASRLTGDFDVVVPDLLGFGESAAPEGDYYMEAQAEGLLWLLGELGIHRLVLGGHDFGGPVALTLLARAGDVLEVDGLILAATNVFTDPFVPLPLRAAGVPLVGPIVFWALAGTRLSLRMMYTAGARRKEEATWARFRRHLTPGGIGLTRRIFQRSLADLDGNYRHVERQLGRVSCPGLVIWGGRDPFFAVAAGERTRDALPRAELRVLDGTGHFVPEERPVEVAEAIRERFGR